MSRFSWTTLPPDVREAVESTLTVSVTRAISTEHTNADLAEVLELADGRWVFVKGAQVPSGEVTHAGLRLAKEARVLPVLPVGAGPTLWFLLDVAGWRLLVTDYIHGRRALLTRGSPDVEIVAHGLAAIAVNRRMTRSPLRTLPNLAYSLAVEEPWRRLCLLNPAGLDDWTYARLGDFGNREHDTIAMCAGYALVHNAIDPSEMVMVRGRWLLVLDWRYAQLGPPWVDLATLAVLLIEHGFDPDEAETVVGRNPVWATADTAAITAYAVQMYGVWELRRLRRPDGTHTAKAAAWRAWAAYRWTEFRAKHRSHP